MSNQLKNNRKEINDLIDSCLIRDQHAFRRQFDRLDLKTNDKQNGLEQLKRLRLKIKGSMELVSERKGKIPTISFPESLPVVEKQNEIKNLIKENQVTILCGETGSGKTTQLPKMLLEIGRGVRGQIAHTQPRRIAASSVANRLAKEMGSEIGDLVGYQVRFSDQSSSNNLIKVMTDGILLSETQSDRYLNKYDTIIIDEAHERNLNVDFLFGYLKSLLEKRRDLKLIITSATIDAEKFSNHFNQAPVIEVSGRLYPVEIKYQLPKDKTGSDDLEDIDDVICRVMEDIDVSGGGGDVLIFLPGEREINQSLDSIRKDFLSKKKRSAWEVLPLYSRLSIQDQRKIFTATKGRRVILSTNIAETSLTIPNIQYVIDSGLARVKRYSYRNKVEMLQVEKVSQASANQRSGRSGRVMNGVCVRLYSEEDYDSRPAHTEPEILRSSLASVILRMSTLGLDEPEKFPFIDPPLSRALADGYQLLEELGAMDQRRRLTSVGKKIARIPVDPRVARMILAGNVFGCLDEILKLAAGLSVQDPRERDFNSSDRGVSAKVSEEKSDFVSLLSVWSWFSDVFDKKPGKKKLREICLKQHISLVRMFEWRELYRHLKSMSADMGFKVNQKAGRHSDIHQALLTGLLGNIGFRGDGDGVYFGARGIKFYIHPGSELRRSKPKWIVASELVETSRLYARCVSEISADWIEPLAKHLTQSTYQEPRWSKSSGNVVASERVTLYGLVIIPRRQINYGPIDPRESREIFIRNALVEGQVKTFPSFLKHNLSLIESLENVEARSRKYDLLVDDSVVYSFFDEKVPEQIWSWVEFEKWRKNIEKKNQRYLYLSKSLLIRKEIESSTFDLYPDFIEMNGCEFKLDYRFEPGHILDGVTLKTPIEMVNKIDHSRVEWLVPGLIREKVTQIVKSLPKSIRRKVFPLPQFIDEVVGDLKPRDNSLYDEVISIIAHHYGVEMTRDAFDETDFPLYLRMNYTVLDELGNELGSSRDLPAMQQKFGVIAKEVFTLHAAPELTQTGIKSWNFGDLPSVVEMTLKGKTVPGFPCIKDEEESVSVIVVDTETEAELVSKKGIQRLFQLVNKDQFKFAAKNWTGLSRAALQYSMLLSACEEPFGPLTVQNRLSNEMLAATSARALSLGGYEVRSQAEFSDLIKRAKPTITVIANEINQTVVETFDLYAKVTAALKANKISDTSVFFQNIKSHLSHLMPPNFISITPHAHLIHFPRYLEALRFRIEKMRSDPQRDQSWQQQISEYLSKLDAAINVTASESQRNQLVEVKWSIEELRVSLWAQQIKTLYPISFKRIERAMAEAMKT